MGTRSAGASGSSSRTPRLERWVGRTGRRRLAIRCSRFRIQHDRFAFAVNSSRCENAQVKPRGRHHRKSESPGTATSKRAPCSPHPLPPTATARGVAASRGSDPRGGELVTAVRLEPGVVAPDAGGHRQAGRIGCRYLQRVMLRLIHPGRQEDSRPGSPGISFHPRCYGAVENVASASASEKGPRLSPCPTPTSAGQSHAAQRGRSTRLRATFGSGPPVSMSAICRTGTRFATMHSAARNPRGKGDDVGSGSAGCPGVATLPWEDVVGLSSCTARHAFGGRPDRPTSQRLAPSARRYTIAHLGPIGRVSVPWPSTDP